MGKFDKKSVNELRMKPLRLIAEGKIEHPTITARSAKAELVWREKMIGKKETCWDILGFEKPTGIVGVTMISMMIEAAYDKALDPVRAQFEKIKAAKEEALKYVQEG